MPGIFVKWSDFVTAILKLMTPGVLHGICLISLIIPRDDEDCS